MSDSSKDGILAVSSSLIGLSSITVGLRFWARKRHNLPIMADDWLAVAALVSSPRHRLESDGARNMSLLTEGLSYHILE